MGCIFYFINFAERSVLEVNFSNGIIILSIFCMLVEVRGIFVTFFEPKAARLDSPILLFSSQRDIEGLLQIGLSNDQLRGDRDVLHQQLVIT